MEIGAKIKTLRQSLEMTQEALAEKLAVSSQAVSKWENGTCAPDIYMLPKLSVVFGVTIDELFDLTADEKLNRIENMLCNETDISDETFRTTEQCLKDQLEKYPKKARVYSLLGRLFHNRMMSDSEKVSSYARTAIKLMPEEKDAQWLLQKAEGAAVTDWNVKQHNKTIEFYSEMVEKRPEIARNYLYLMDNLLLDRRTAEAKDILERYRKAAGHQEMQLLIYEARIAECAGQFEAADEFMAKLLETFGDNSGALFDAAGFYADRCEYDRAMELFEASYEKAEKPRFTDELSAMAIIYEIKKQYGEAVKCHERILKALNEEWGITEGAGIDEERSEIERLKYLSQKNK